MERHNQRTQQEDYRSGIIASNIIAVFASKDDVKKYPPSYFFPSLERINRDRGANGKSSSPEDMLTLMQTLYPPGEK